MPSLVPPELHPMVIHFPIVILLLAALLCLFARRLPWAGQALPWLFTLGTVSAIVAVVTGLIQRPHSLEAWEGTAKESWINIHMILGFIVVGVSLALAVTAWVMRRSLATNVGWPMIVSTCVVAGLVSVTGWYGGAIVWDSLPIEEGGQLGSSDGGNPFDAGGSTGTPTSTGSTTSPAATATTTTSSTGTSTSNPTTEPDPGTTPTPSDGCPVFAAGAATDHTGGYDGFFGEDKGIAGDSGLPIWEFTVVSSGQHSFNVNAIKVPVCREIHVTHVNQPGSAKHDLDFGDWQKQNPFVLNTPEISGGQTSTGQFNVRVVGEVDFYCSVGRHAELGQRGIFTVATV